MQRILRHLYKQLAKYGSNGGIKFKKNFKPLTRKLFLVGSPICFIFSIIYCWQSVKNPFETYQLLSKSIISANFFENNTSARKRFNFIGDVVRKCAPAVVYVEIKDKNKINPITGQPMITSNGSGFIVRNDGLIVTNAHVVINKPNALITVLTHDGSSYEATIENADLNIDLALLKIKSKKTFPVAKLGTAKDLNVGEWVVALGNPLSLNQTATVGVISCVNRSAYEIGLTNVSTRYIQTDATITFGNSGGPLLNLDGDVIGINNLRVTTGIAFAIPIDCAKDYISNQNARKNNMFSSINARNIDERCIGIATFTVSSDLVKYLLQEHKLIPDDISHGIYVWKVASNTPAHTSGIKEGDIITHINGIPVRQPGDIYIILSKKDAVLKANVYREGTNIEIIINPADIKHS